MSQDSVAAPELIVIAGPNGAGKSTTAPVLLPGVLSVTTFVNADVIAQGLAGYSPESVALEAGRIMLERLRSLADQRRNFAFETTLASRSYGSWISALQSSGYRARLVFIWLSSPEVAVQRVQERVKAGGHHVDPDTIIRRYERGLRNFFQIYRRIADDWRMYNNSTTASPRLIASGKKSQVRRVADKELWARLTKVYEND
jgi:predicted ABC-type ATPase